MKSQKYKQENYTLIRFLFALTCLKKTTFFFDRFFAYWQESAVLKTEQNENPVLRENLHLINKNKTRQETKLRPHNTRLWSQAG